jgi:hypothetical protein
MYSSEARTPEALLAPMILAELTIFVYALPKDQMIIGKTGYAGRLVMMISLLLKLSSCWKDRIRWSFGDDVVIPLVLKLSSSSSSWSWSMYLIPISTIAVLRIHKSTSIGKVIWSRQSPFDSPAFRVMVRDHAY